MMSKSKKENSCMDIVDIRFMPDEVVATIVFMGRKFCVKMEKALPLGGGEIWLVPEGELGSIFGKEYALYLAGFFGHLLSQAAEGKISAPINGLSVAEIVHRRLRGEPASAILETKLM